MSEGNELVEGLRIFEEEEEGGRCGATRGGQGDANPHHTCVRARALDTCECLTRPAGSREGDRPLARARTRVPCCALCLAISLRVFPPTDLHIFHPVLNSQPSLLLKSCFFFF